MSTPREPEVIRRQVETWRPESLLAYEKRRRAQRTTEHDRLMQEAAAMFGRALAEEAEAKKGGRPPKDGTTLKGTGVIRFNNAPRARTPKPEKPVSRCACGAKKRGSAVSCPPCTAARYAEVRRARSRRAVPPAGERAA